MEIISFPKPTTTFKTSLTAQNSISLNPRTKIQQRNTKDQGSTKNTKDQGITKKYQGPRYNIAIPKSMLKQRNTKDQDTTKKSV